MLESSQLQAADLLARAVKELLDTIEPFTPRRDATSAEAHAWIRQVLRARSALTIYSDIRSTCTTLEPDDITEPAFALASVTDLVDVAELACPACGSTNFEGTPGCSCCDVTPHLGQDELAPITERTA